MKLPSLIPELEFLSCAYRNQCCFCNSTHIRYRVHFEEHFAAFYSKRLIYYDVGRTDNLVKVDHDYRHSFFCLINSSCRQARCANCRQILTHNDITERTQYLRITYTGFWIADLLSSFLRSLWEQQHREPEEDIQMIITRDNVPKRED